MPVVASHAPGTFCWVDLATTDAAGATRFYTQLFGWNFEDRPAGVGTSYTMFDLGGRSVAALYQQVAEQPGLPPCWLSYVSVESVERTAERTASLGGTVILEPFEVFEVGRMALIQDPTHAFVALWEPRTHVGAGIVGEPGSLCWNELATTDPERAGEFYSGLLGWEVERQLSGDSTYTYFRQGDGHTCGMTRIEPETDAQVSRWLAYFAVDDCDHLATRATSLGARLTVPPTAAPGTGRFAVVVDPQGAEFAVKSM